MDYAILDFLSHVLVCDEIQNAASNAASHAIDVWGR